jgi:hypothetical protein
MNVAVIYLVLILIWIAIIIALRLYETNYVGLLILLIPIFIFAITTYYSDDEHLVSNHSIGSDDDFLSVGIVLLLPLLAYLDKNFDDDKGKFICLIIISLFIFLMTTMVCWLPQRYAKIGKMIRTGLQVIALGLVLVAIHIYYQHRCKKINQGVKYEDLIPLFECP